MSHFASILRTQFNASVPNEDLNLLRDIKRLHPDQKHVALVESSFPLSGFLHAKGIEFVISDDAQHAAHELFSWNNSSRELYAKLLTGVLTFHYEDTAFTVYKASWIRDHQQRTLYDFVFDAADGSDAVGRALVAAVHAWAHELKDEIWVFQQGAWTKDKALWAAVQAASWGEIVLDSSFLEGLRRDTETFFTSQEIYKSLGIVWKRGLLLLGAIQPIHLPSWIYAHNILE